MHSGLHSRRILSAGWNPRSTNEASFIAPLAKASVLFKETVYREAALAAAAHYARRHLSMREPYWGGTSDASCEDKEAAALAFAGFLELYELTHSPEHLAWARHACDVMLTYTYVWDVPMPAGRLADHRVRTRGWTSVSVQNMHSRNQAEKAAPTAPSDRGSARRFVMRSGFGTVSPGARNGEATSSA